MALIVQKYGGTSVGDVGSDQERRPSGDPGAGGAATTWWSWSRPWLGRRIG